MSGDVLYSSILYWNATNILARLYEEAGPAHAGRADTLRARAAKVRAGRSCFAPPPSTLLATARYPVCVRGRQRLL